METQYAVHSVVRSTAFRLYRATLPQHQKKRHLICNQTLRLLPGRRLLISEKSLLKHLEELQEKAKLHILEVRTPDGRLVDLSTMATAPAEPKVLLPHPRLDSVAYDRPTGQYIPPYVGDDTAMPQVLPAGQKPQLLTQEAETKALDDAAAADKLEEKADAELEAAVASAQAEAAPPPQEEVSSRKGKRGRR
jgi:hypothetical protein